MHTKFIMWLADLTVTLLSFFFFITWTTFVTFIPTILAMLYWVPKIKYTVVNKYYNGSWYVWVKSLFKKK